MKRCCPYLGREPKTESWMPTIIDNMKKKLMYDLYNFRKLLKEPRVRGKKSENCVGKDSGKNV